MKDAADLNSTPNMLLCLFGTLRLNAFLSVLLGSPIGMRRLEYISRLKVEMPIYIRI